ncbi:MAG: IclR family transcriptional regulator [Hydrogenophaga sp.]|uniref:IclR family transcriptional regulator n=1 Tax=Hydrogenophaga sp. TaxID=1904254 RepID=UPI001DE26C2B|nr:IclR family transcriptional regulator [Hydrogenophaga sp.]MBX3610543.1 IclR family transcriptional regulator [Hydrogenophaga sp.]
MATRARRAPDAPTPGDGYVQSFARGLGVIRSFNAQASQQTLSEVAERSGLTRAGARRILLTLQALGYVSTDGKHYALTPRILELGFAYLTSMPIWNLAEPVMERLADAVGESCSAAVLDGSDIIYVLRVHTHKIMAINLNVGTRLPAYCTSLGRVLLAGLDDTEVKARLKASDIRANTRHTETDVDEILARVQQVRRQGWSLVNQELEEGLISIAAPVKNRAGQVIAALNVSGQANRTSATVMKEQLLPKLRAAADEVSGLLGRG